MYSNSSSFLGGVNSNRPGPPQYGQSSFANAQPPPQQPNTFAQTPTGYNGGAIQNQFTGFPSQLQPRSQSFHATQQQPQFTGYPHAQQSFQNQALPSPQAPLSTQNPRSQILSQPTGQTSSQIAQSFQSTGSAQPPAPKASSSGVKIPKIRLSFLTAQDQAKFEQLFKSAVGDGQALDGDKVRDLLLRSKLSGSDLSHIWILSDTTKSGQLLFPEFALAMYLCNLKLVGKDLPRALPEKIANEVSSIVDIISFGVPDNRPSPAPRTNAPNFDIPSRSTASPNIQQPQPQMSNTQLLTQITSQPTGFASQYIPPQPTGFQQQTPSLGFSPQQTGFQQQNNTLQLNSQPTAYSGPRPPMPPMPTGFDSNYLQAQGSSASLPLNAQPTGKPGQWGLVNTPTSGLPNIEALQQRMMPQSGREGGYTTAGLSGTATVPWAVTKDEKRIYDGLFKAWDGLNKGFIGGDAALEVMGQSGLDKTDLEKIWTLSDPGNKGRLDMDEFAVAMHLIYRRLNGYPVPNRLPPELVPPSTRNFADSIGTVKSLLSQDAETRKSTGNFLQPQKTGVSYLKHHSFRTDPISAAPGRKDATVFRNNDDDIGYKSSARRRLGGGGRTPSPAPSSPASETSNDDLTVEQLRKRIREKQILLDAIDYNDENAFDNDDALDREDRREAEDLYYRIRRLQDDVDSHPSAVLRNIDSAAERRSLRRQLQGYADRLPELASQVRKAERSIADARLELFRLKDARAHPGSTGTGPGGTLTESDRLKARAKAMMQQRSAALSGRPIPSDGDDTVAASRRLDTENTKIRGEKENNERMIKDVEDSVRDFSRGLEDSLKDSGDSAHAEHEKRRWEDGLGVEDEVKSFIFDLQRSSRAARVRHEESDPERQDQSYRSGAPHKDSARSITPTRYDNPLAAAQDMAKPKPLATSSAGASYSSYKTAEERAAFIKQQAEQRMAERLAALGLRPPTKSSESAQEKQERETRERDERRQQAAAEDAKRDQDRQRRLAEEQLSPPKVANKKPPPPPSRKSRTDSVGQKTGSKASVDEEILRQKAEHEGKEQAIKQHQAVQEAETKRLENQSRRQEDELVKEREAAEARSKDLEEQVKAGKIRKQEEKRRRQAAEKEARGNGAKLAAQRAELEAAKERERKLQLELESLGDDDSSDDENAREVTPQDTTPTNSQILPQHNVSIPATPTSILSKGLVVDLDPSTGVQGPPALVESVPVSSSGYSSETKNPFFKKLSQPNEQSSVPPSQPTSSITSPSVNEVSTNPFHRLTQQENAAKSIAPLSSTLTGNRPSRVRPEEDEWSVVDSTEDSSDDEDERPTAGGAKQLASMLFGSMGPPRPLSAMDEKPSLTPTSPEQAFSPATSSAPPMPNLEAPLAPPPPPPKMPGSFESFGDASSAPPAPPPPPGNFGVDAPGAPPPPPPPHPSSGSTLPAGHFERGAFLGEIGKGKALKKVETKDRSQSSVAGRVLN